MNQNNCPQCGMGVSDELPGGLCPACLMAAAQQTQHNIARTQPLPGGIRIPSVEEISQLFPELEILQLVGRGGMGAVYKVRQKNLDRIVALKVFLYRPGDPEFAARFQREAQALAKLNHPNIVTVHDFGQRGQSHFLIMEFVDGLNLRQLTLEERLSPELALQMVPQLCDALQYAHDHGVIHRDIKPENLLLDTKGQINIADFGLAKMTGGDPRGTLTGTQQVMGTIDYMAPEQRERPTEVDHRADIYSLGVVIYEMLTGELPIGRFQPPSSKSDVNGQLDDAVLRALEKEPSRRYQQVSEFKTGVESAQNHLPPQHVNAAKMVPVAAIAAATDQPRERVNGTRCTFAIMSGVEKKGNWTPGNPQLAFTLMGGTEIDLTHVSAREVNLTLFTLMGGAEVIVPQGATVDLDGLILMGGSTDKVVRTDRPSGMHVRVRSWGAMGGCEVRTAKHEIPVAASEKKLNPYHTADNDIAIGFGLAFAYRMFAMLVTIAIPIIFLMGTYDIIGHDTSRLYGILTAIFAGLIWSASGYFRILVNAGPEDTSPEAVAKYQSATKVGTAIRVAGLVLVFACPMLFILANFQAPHQNTLRFAAIICAIIGVMTKSAAGNLEDFLREKR